MADRHVCNDVFNKMLIELKTQLHNEALSTPADAEWVTTVTRLCCGFHLVINLATAASNGLTEFERMMNMVDDVGARSVLGFKPSRS